jgi:hypothetical protein
MISGIGPKMSYTINQTEDQTWQDHDPNAPKEARDLYRELSESGIFNISWQQFMWYWFQSRSDDLIRK